MPVSSTWFFPQAFPVFLIHDNRWLPIRESM